MTRGFKQVDVFTAVPFQGNPLAVVLNANGLSGDQMQSIARWTNLSETTFVLPATDSAADYRVRIFTTQEEFPFAGHPTLGTAYALLQAGLQPKNPGVLIQECGVGLVPVRIAADGAMGFLAPAAQLEPMNTQQLKLLYRALGVNALASGHAPVAANIGICWLIVRLESVADCLSVAPDAAALAELMELTGCNGMAVYAPHGAVDLADYEVRAFMVENGRLLEDPVTGSANACIARLLPARNYRARQGTALGRDGRITVIYEDGEPWIYGKVVTIIDGEINC